MTTRGRTLTAVLILAGILLTLIPVVQTCTWRTMAELGDHKESEWYRTRLKHLHQLPGEPRPGEWRHEHEEQRQSFADYLSASPTRPTATRHRLYLQWLGDQTKHEDSLLLVTADYLHHFYGIEVMILPLAGVENIPASALRQHPGPGQTQLWTQWVLNDWLQPRLPEDAAAMMAFTSIDLYPNPKWNFVFGQASLKDRVGVWSVHRFGDPTESSTAFRRVLSRTLKTASHETGHLFSLRHCDFFECVMAGSNHLEEADEKPHFLCPECLPKVCWNLDLNPVSRFDTLGAFWQSHGFQREAEFARQSAGALRQSRDLP